MVQDMHEGSILLFGLACFVFLPFGGAVFNGLDAKEIPRFLSCLSSLFSLAFLDSLLFSQRQCLLFHISYLAALLVVFYFLTNTAVEMFLIQLICWTMMTFFFQGQDRNFPETFLLFMIPLSPFYHLSFRRWHRWSFSRIFPTRLQDQR